MAAGIEQTVLELLVQSKQQQQQQTPHWKQTRR